METSNDTYSSLDFTDQMLHTGFLVDKYYTPVVCFCGALGNALSLAVFCGDSKYRRQSSSFYLSALAVSDTGFLLSMFLIWVQGMYGHVITSAFTCPLVMYLGQVTCFLSVYLIVAFSIERYVAVINPFNKPRLFTLKKAKRVIVGLICIALLTFSYVWIIAKVIQVKYPAPLDNQTNEQSNLARAIHLSALTNSSVETEIQQITEILLKLRNTSTVSYGESHLERQMFEDFLLEIVALESSKLEVEKSALKTSDNRHANDTFTSESSYYQCTVPEEYYKVSEIANYLDSVVTLIVPFMLITLLNVRIYLSLRTYMMERNAIMSESLATPPATALFKNNDSHHQILLRKPSTSYAPSFVRKSSSKSLCQANSAPQNDQGLGKPGETRPRFSLGQNSTEVRVTKTLLLVSTVFLVLNLPLHFIRCAQFIQYMGGSYNEMDLLRAFQPWATMLFNTNFAVNFILYCLSGRNFRKSLRRLFTSSVLKEPISQIPRMSSVHGHHRFASQPPERSSNFQRSTGYDRDSSPPTTIERGSSVAVSEHEGPAQRVFTRVEDAQQRGSNARAAFSEENGNNKSPTRL